MASLDQDLLDRLERGVAECRRSGVRYETPHLLLALLESAEGTAARALEQLRPGLSATIRERLLAFTSEAEPASTREFVPFVWSEREDVQLASELAESEGNPAITERHLLLGVLSSSSNTVQSLRRSLAEDGAFEKLIEIVGSIDDEQDQGQETIVLLQRWHGGDAEALNDLVARDLPWIRKKVHFRLGDELRAKAETVDYVQDAMLELFRYGPRFQMDNRAHFRALVARIIENVLRGKHDWYHAQRRRMARERPLPSDSMIQLDRPANSVTTPSVAADRSERKVRVRLAFELLDPDDREVLVLREWERLSFRDIGERLGLSEDAARMRFQRALPKLAEKLSQLDAGDMEGLLGERPDDQPEG